MCKRRGTIKDEALKKKGNKNDDRREVEGGLNIRLQLIHP
jgi:hypothetical protein